MKQELPIAICLLAAGAAFWGWSSRSPRPVQTARTNALIANPAGNRMPVQAAPANAVNFKSERAQPRTATLGNPSRIPARTAGHRASLRGLGTRQSSERPPAASTTLDQLGPVLAPADFRPAAGKSSDAQAEMLLRRAQHIIDDGPAFESSIQLQADLFGHPIAGTGVYSQAGQGSGQTRTTLQFRSLATVSVEPQQRLTSVCDGRFTYRLHHNLIDDDRTLEFYDLTQIKRAGSSGDSAIASIPLGPGQLMTGGLAGLMKELAEQFQFVIVKPATNPTNSSNSKSSSAESTTFRLRGSWKPKQLHHIVRQKIPAGSGQAITWDQLPPNLPHAVEVVLTATEASELFPQRVCFYQYRTRGQITQAQPIATFQFAAPQAIVNAASDLFVMKSDDLEATDVTQQYLSRLHSGGHDEIR